jgi:hypothetical protein
LCKKPPSFSQLLRTDGNLRANNDDEILEFGKSSENPTKGRLSINAPITNGRVISLLGNGTTPAGLTTAIRDFLLKQAFVLPRDGNGLSVVYNDLQYTPQTMSFIMRGRLIAKSL